MITPKAIIPDDKEEPQFGAIFLLAKSLGMNVKIYAPLGQACIYMQIQHDGRLAHCDHPPWGNW